MKLVCLQCAMKAMLEDAELPTFDETPEEHMRRCHADKEATQRERVELERAIHRKMLTAEAAARSN